MNPMDDEAGMTPAVVPRFCSSCGAALPPGSNNCSQCGAAVFPNAPNAWPAPSSSRSSIDDIANAVEDSGMLPVVQTYLWFKIIAGAVGIVMFIIFFIFIMSQISQANQNQNNPVPLIHLAAMIGLLLPV